MSDLRVNTISASDGTSPVTLTKQQAAKACYGVSLFTATYRGIAGNTLSSESLNISSFSDGGTGAPTLSITSAFTNAQYVNATDAQANNNTGNIGQNSTASSIQVVQKDADSNTSADNLSFGVLFGDLA
jgi:hypothetical protein